MSKGKGKVWVRVGVVRARVNVRVYIRVIVYLVHTGKSRHKD